MTDYMTRKIHKFKFNQIMPLVILIAVYFPCHCVLFGFHGFKEGATAYAGKKNQGKITNPEHLFISFSWEMKFSHHIPQPPFAFPFS